MNPDIDIVIPCAGRTDDLLRLLGSLHEHAAQGLVRHVASITATDDRHSDDLGQRLRATFPQVRYVPGPARGPAANRNHGARQGRAAWLLFLDDDCHVRHDLIAAYAQGRATHATARVLEGAIHAVGMRPNGNHHAPLNSEGGKLWSCNVLVERALFEALGGFDEQFPYACLEDNDLHRRLLAAGAGIAFVPGAAVLHPWRSISEREVTRQIISHAIFAQKHPDFARAFDLLHLLRAMRGRLALYSSGQPTSIPMTKYRTVAYDFAAPLAVYAVVRIAPLRRHLWQRYRNAVPERAAAIEAVRG